MEIEQYRIDLGKQVQNAMEKAIENMHPKYIYGSESDVKFYIPKIALGYLNDYLSSQPYNMPNGIDRYRGYEIIEGYELMVILVHNSYPTHNDPQSISKIKI